MRLKDRIRAFALKHRLTHRELAERLTTPYHTFKNWMLSKECSTQPPACMVAFMDVLEHCPEARKHLGIDT